MLAQRPGRIASAQNVQPKLRWSAKHSNISRYTMRASEQSTVTTVETIQKTKLLYNGVVLDMDGTLTEAHIDFADMRARTGIPMGDLFTVMEAWTDDARIKAAMDVILEIEAGASSVVRTKEGLDELMTLLQESGVRVALVTRNTTSAVEAFFRVAPQWRGLFDPVLTREFQYVKPDKRLLQHVAQTWDLPPSSLLMVGDSFEDVEVGNAAGTASCLIAGGGNEKPGANITPPAGAVPTFAVNSLTQLRDMLRDGPKEAGQVSEDGALQLGWPAREGKPKGGAGAPPPGLEFLDYLVGCGALRNAAASFPRMGRAAGGLATCSEWGDQVLHIGCGTGGLTKMMASQGVQTSGIDSDVEAATTRGLKAVQYAGAPLSSGSLQPALAQCPGGYNAVVIFDTGCFKCKGALAPVWPSEGALQEVGSVLQQGGRLCIETTLPAEVSQEAAQALLAAQGFEVTSWQQLTAMPRIRAVARKL